MPNVHEPEFDYERDQPGFHGRVARVGSEAGARRLGASVREVDPGQAAYPYHYHLAEEELVLVLVGRPSLRTPEGWSELAPGDVVSFPVGERGAHQIVNRTDERVRFLAFSTWDVAEICVYPDSDKIGVYDDRMAGGELEAIFRRRDAVDYYDGEQGP